MQVPIAVALDAIFRKPQWMQSVGAGIVTFSGASAVLVGFFALTASSAEESKGVQAGVKEETGAELSSGYNEVVEVPLADDQEDA